MPLTRRSLLRGLPLLLALPRATQAQEAVTWEPSSHWLNDPRTCLGWWMATPLSGTVTWRDLLRQRPATLTNMALLSSATSGLQRRTTRVGGWGHIAFDGTNDEVVLPDVLNNPSALTLSCWVKTSTTTYTGLITRLTSPNGVHPGWRLRLLEDTGYIGFAIQESDSVSYGFTTTVSVTDGQWHHILVTMPSYPDPFALYVDGRSREYTLQTLGTVTDASTATLPRLGRFGDGTYPLVGQMDDVRLYNRPALASEARFLYTQGRLRYPDLLAPDPALAYAPTPPVPTVKLPSLLFHH